MKKTLSCLLLLVILVTAVFVSPNMSVEAKAANYVYFLQVQGGGNFLDCNGMLLSLQSFDGSAAQQWDIVNHGSYYTIKGGYAGGLYLSAGYPSMPNLAQPILSGSINDQAKWSISYGGDGGTGMAFYNQYYNLYLNFTPNILTLSSVPTYWEPFMISVS